MTHGIRTTPTEPTPGDVSTATADCANPNCRNLDARLAAFDAALAASTARVDRLTLGLRPARTKAVTA